MAFSLLFGYLFNQQGGKVTSKGKVIQICLKGAIFPSIYKLLAAAPRRAGGWKGALFNTGLYMHSKNWPAKITTKYFALPL